MKKIFHTIYKNKLWGKDGPVSGPGSKAEATKEIKKILPKLIDRYQITSVLDAPCGDFNWMKDTNLNIDNYIGIDIVPEIIQQNNQIYSNQTRKFLSLDISKDPLPKTDLIICRDCLVHFSYHDIQLTLNNFKKSNAKFLLTTTFTDHSKNTDIKTGKWRPLNLRKSPFNFPPPIFTINEKCKEGNGAFADKSMALWRLDSLS